MILNIVSVVVTAAGPFTLTLQASNIIAVLSLGASPVPLSNFGHDLALTTDEDPGQSEVDGWPCLAQALVRRLQCAQGQLPGDPDYGYDLLGEIDDDIDIGDAAQIGASIDAEFIKDQRVQSSTTTVTFALGAQAAQASGAQSPTPTFTPASLSGLVAWYRSDDVTLSGSNVATWPDKSGNGYTQSPTGTAPTYVASGGAGGRPYLSWTSAAALISTALTGLAQPFEVIAIVRTPAGLTTGYLFDFNANDNITFAGSGTLSEYAGSVGPTVSAASSADMFVDSLFSGSSSMLQINNATAGTGNPGTGSASTHMTIGNYSNGLSTAIGWRGFIYEIIVYNRALLSSERSQLKTYSTSLYLVP
jgi:hypothetical protein